MLLYPAPGLRVRDPRTRAVIPATGVEVGPHDFDLWKMLRQGDLSKTPASPAKPAAQEAAPAAPAPAPAPPIAASAAPAPVAPVAEKV